MNGFDNFQSTATLVEGVMATAIGIVGIISCFVIAHKGDSNKKKKKKKEKEQNIKVDYYLSEDQYIVRD